MKDKICSVCVKRTGNGNERFAIKKKQVDVIICVVGGRKIIFNADCSKSYDRNQKLSIKALLKLLWMSKTQKIDELSTTIKSKIMYCRTIKGEKRKRKKMV